MFCQYKSYSATHTHTHTRLMALFPGLPKWAGTRKVKSIWILLKQETVSDSGISWAICTSAPCCKQVTMPAPHRSVFYRPDALPAAQPTASKHWRPKSYSANRTYILQSCSADMFCRLTVNFVLLCRSALLCRFNIPTHRVQAPFTYLQSSNNSSTYISA